MRMERFDLNLIVFLDALLEEQNVTRAGERLNIGQSAASGALARLREYFGDELLVPVGRRMMLTPLARDLVQPVRATMLTTRATLALKPGFDPSTAERRFSIIASDYVTSVLLKDVVSHIADIAPGIQLEINGPGSHVTERFERGDIDLLVIPKPYLSKEPHPAETLFEDKHVCVVWNENRLVGARLDFDQFMSLGHVATKFDGARAPMFEDWFLPRFGRPRRIDVSIDNFGNVPALLVGTQRIAILHGRLAKLSAQYLPLRLVPPPFEIPTLVEYMQWHSYLDRDPAHVWLRSILRRFAAALPSVQSLTSL